MKHTKIKTNFIYPNVKPEHYKFGSNKISGNVLREDGDWRNYLPPEEEQNKRGIESSACYIEAQQHAIATILEEQYNLFDRNFSARFNAYLSGGTEQGGDPLVGAESMRNDGLIPDELMPFGDDIQSWNDFHSWKGTDEGLCRQEGDTFLKEWKLNYDIVFTRDEPIEIKMSKLREALKYSPVPMSVYAWYQDSQENYIKPEGVNDNHLVECVYLDENNCPYVRDTYSPFLKKLEANYNSDFSLRWTVNRKEIEGSWCKTLIGNIKRYFKL